MSPNKIVFTILVLNIYFKITKQDVSSISITKYVIAVQKAIDKLQNTLYFHRLMICLIVVIGNLPT